MLLMPVLVASLLLETVVGPVWTVELEVALVSTSRTGATAVSLRVLGAAV